MFRPTRLLTMLALSLASLACAPDAHHVVHDGRSAPSDGGNLTIDWTLASPLAREGNRFTVTLKDERANDAALTGATVNLELVTADGSTSFESAATEGTAGTYANAEPVAFPSAGEWHLVVHVSKGHHDAPDALHDHATFRLQVP